MRVADPACISTWFPMLAATGVPVPKTEIIAGAPADLLTVLDGKPVTGFDGFIARVRTAAERLGYPAFLRSGHLSGKHGWRRTCYLENGDRLASHVVAIVEAAAMADLFGLPLDVWAVRQFLPLAIGFHAFEGLPIARERRYFIANGAVCCHHAYWPVDAIRQPDAKDWRKRLFALNAESVAEVQHLSDLSMRVAAVFPGAWSLDWAQDVTGIWWVIDMAPAAQSYHSSGCPMAAQFSADQEGTRRTKPPKEGS